MKIAINAWVLRKKELDGIGTVTVETVCRIIKNNPEVSFLILCDRKFAEDYFDFPNATICRIFPPFRHPFLYVIYLEVFLPIFLRKHKPDIFLSLDGMISLSSNTPQIACIHDINFMHQPKDLDLKNRIYFRTFFKRFAEKASRIATVSLYSKQDISSTFSISPEKIDVIYCGIKKGLKLYTSEEQDQTRANITNGHPYFLFVGTLHPRKNIIRLLKAFDYFKNNYPSDIQLVIVGSFMWDGSDINETYASLSCKQDIHVTGRVSESQLSALYGAAMALTFVPTFEGFGLPIIEGFTAGIPVITSNITSMPEVAGDAALLVDPFNELEIANAMLQIAENKNELRTTLIEKGLLRAQKFSWDITSQLLWDCTMRTISINTHLPV